MYFSSVVLSKCAYDPAAMRRAVFERASAVSSLPEGYSVKELRLFQGEVEFEHSKRKTEETRRKEKEEDTKLIASPSGKLIIEVKVSLLTRSVRIRLVEELSTS